MMDPLADGRGGTGVPPVRADRRPAGPTERAG